MPASLRIDRTRMQGISLANVIVTSEISGPLSAVISLYEHLSHALGSTRDFPPSLADIPIFKALEHLLNQEQVSTYIAGFFEVPDAGELTVADRAFFFECLARPVLQERLPTWLQQERANTDTHAGYAITELAMSLWATGTCASRNHAFVLSACLLYEPLAAVAKPALRLPAPVKLVLDNYLELDEVAATLCDERDPGALFSALLEHCGANVLYLNAATARCPTREEREHGSAAGDGKKMLVTGLVQQPPQDVLNALLLVRPFKRWQAEVTRAVHWLETPHAAATHHALAEQLLLDSLYPPHRRRPGFLLDFNLFGPGRGSDSFVDIRQDLCNSVQASLACSTAVAALASALLVRHLAPELLIERAPAGFVYRPDLRWANLRLGARTLQASDTPITFEAAERAYGTASATEPDPSMLGIDLEWAVLNRLVEEKGAYTRQELAFVAWLFERTWALESLVPPDRVAQAIVHLKACGLTRTPSIPDNALVQAPSPSAQHCPAPATPPYESGSVTSAYLQAYLDGDYAQIPHYSPTRLPDINTWFEQAFNHYTANLTYFHETVWKTFVDQLAHDDKQRLETYPWVAYSIGWPRYIGSVQGAIPGYGDAPATDWAVETAPLGVVFHQRIDDTDWLYECFPLRWQCEVTQVSDPQRRAWLNSPADELKRVLPLDYERYNGVAKRWEMSNAAQCSTIRSAGGQEPLAGLSRFWAEKVALSGLNALKRVCRGVTAKELATQNQQQRSLWQYLWHLTKRTVPLVGCVDVNDGGDALGCVADGVTLLATGIKVGNNLARPLVAIAQKRTPLAQRSFALAHQALLRHAHPTGQRTINLGLGVRRWHSEPALASPVTASVDTLVDGYPAKVTTTSDGRHFLVEEATGNAFGPPLDTLPTTMTGQFTRHARPSRGQTPALLATDAAEDYEGAISLQRDTDTVEVIIDGQPYRQHHTISGHMLLHTRHAPLFTHGGKPSKPLPTRLSTPAGPAFEFAPPPLDAPSPPLGTLISRAMVTQHIEPARMRFRPNDLNDGLWADVFVRDNKVMQQSDIMKPAKNGVPAKPSGRMQCRPLLPEQARVRLGITAPPKYHRRIQAERHTDPAFGLPANLAPHTLTHINDHCPVLRVHGLAETIPDRRILRGIIVQWRGERWLMLEPDLGVFYGAEYATPAVLGQRLTFSRLRDPDAIQTYLEVSETYRVVAVRPQLQQDVINLTELLHDWIRLRPSLAPLRPSAFFDAMAAAEHSQLPTYARNILTRSGAQNALAHFTKGGMPTLAQEILSHWVHASRLPAEQQLHVVGVLNNLLPAGGHTQAPYYPMRTALLSSPLVSRALQQHLGGANFAFSLVTLNNGERRVYFALSGGRAHRRIGLQPPFPGEHSPVKYIDARELMAGQPINPRFTDLPTLRTPHNLQPRQHARHLDAERLIASVMSNELLGIAASVTDVRFFTLFDTCRSCGGFVLPRLRLDFYNAEFSLSFLLDYTNV